MRLDQEKAGVAFDPPVNAVWTDEEASFPAPVFVTFHPEILNDKSTFQQDGASPFVTAVWHFADYDEFRKHESIRTLVRTKFWETIKRAAIHYERQQWDLWNAEVKTVLGEEPDHLRSAEQFRSHYSVPTHAGPNRHLEDRRRAIPGYIQQQKR